MKSWVVFCASLILVLGIACSSTPLGDEIGPAAQGESDNSSGTVGIEWPISFKVAEVLEHDQREGEPGPASSIEDRLKAATLEFNENGNFVYNSTRGSSTLYPVEGKYRVENDQINFSGQKSHSYGSAGSSSINVEGKVDLSGAEGLVASILVTERVKASISDYGGTRSTNKTSVYSGNLLLEPMN